jgi:hypothetical protein
MRVTVFFRAVHSDDETTVPETGASLLLLGVSGPGGAEGAASRGRKVA